MLQVLLWWLIIEAMGLIALPIALRLFRFLPDRGYAFARPLGLLLTSYIAWLLASFGILRNEAVTILFAMLLVAAFSAYLYKQHAGDILAFLRQEKRLILTIELVFGISLAVWAWFRAYNPALDATERPMDLAFLNAILRSERFPPNDPWLSGFALSYYYFGYLMMATLTKLSGIPAAIAFNLSIALLFALTMSGAFSLVYNMVRQSLATAGIKPAATEGERQSLATAGIKPAATEGKRDIWASPTLFGLLGSFLTVVIGNLHGFLDALRARGLGSPAFWEWLDLKKIADAPVTGRWIPTDPPDPWWWWRASRVIHDRDLLGRDSEVIDEFPFFSFLLGDMHPHVLGLPFVLLAMALALNVLFGFVTTASQAKDEEREAEGSRPSRLLDRVLGIFRTHAFDIVLWALCLGGLSFLNTWDFPIYLFIFLAAFTLRYYWVRGTVDWRELVIFAGWIAVLGVILYLPFYIGFRSQAGGILPVLYNVTKLQQYLIMFGLFIFVVLSLIVHQWRGLLSLVDATGRKWLRSQKALLEGLQTLGWILLLPLSALTLSVVLIVSTKRGRAFLQDLIAHPDVQKAIGGQGINVLLRRFALMRLQDPWLVLLLVAMLSALVLLIWYRLRAAREVTSGSAEGGGHLTADTTFSVVFVALLGTTGLLLTLSTEFVYLRDFFGTRMNTIFKFWYQAWVQLAIASAFGVWCIMQGRRRATHYIWLAAFLLLFVASMVYPLAAMNSKGQGFAVEPTLDGIAYMKQRHPGDYAAIQWLQENVQGAPSILEAPGGSYTEFGRVSAQTGLPTVLGWDFHEQQWRGTYEEPGKRLPDIEKIYKSLDRKVVLDLLDKYKIEYVYIGDLERAKYGLQPPMIEKFGRIMDLVYDQGGVRIYWRR